MKLQASAIYKEFPEAKKYLGLDDTSYLDINDDEFAWHMAHAKEQHPDETPGQLTARAAYRIRTLSQPHKELLVSPNTPVIAESERPLHPRTIPRLAIIIWGILVLILLSAIAARAQGPNSRTAMPVATCGTRSLTAGVPDFVAVDLTGNECSAVTVNATVNTAGLAISVNAGSDSTVGTPIYGRATAAAPSYSANTFNPLSIDSATGALRVSGTFSAANTNAAPGATISATLTTGGEANAIQYIFNANTSLYDRVVGAAVGTGVGSAGLHTTALMGFNGSTWDRITSTSGAIDVNLKTSGGAGSTVTVTFLTPTLATTANITQIGTQTVQTAGVNGLLAVGGLTTSGSVIIGNPLVIAASSGNTVAILQVDGSSNLKTVQPLVTYNATPNFLTDQLAKDLQIDEAANLKTAYGIVVKQLSAWTNATALNATQNLYTSDGPQAVVLQLVQTTTLTMGAITIEVTFDGTNWVTVQADQVLDPASATLTQIPVPYTFQANTNRPFLLLTHGAQGMRIKLSTQITGTGSVTPSYTLQYSAPVQQVITLSPNASNFQVTANGGTGNFTVVQAAASNLNATVTGSGTAGSPVAGVLSIQGVNGMTPVKIDGSGVTQPISGSISVSGSTTVVQATGTNLHVVCDGGSCGASSKVDNSAFAAGVDVANAVAGFYHATRDSLTDGRSGALALNVNRAVITQIEDTNKNAVGVTNNALDSNVKNWAGNTAVTGGTNGSVGVGGLAASGAVVAGNPVLTAGASGSTVQTLVMENATPVSTDYGLVVRNIPSGTQNSNLSQVGGATVLTGIGTSATSQRVTLANVDPCSTSVVKGFTASSTATSAQIITGSGGNHVYICAINVGPMTTATGVAVVDGTGTTCATNIHGLLTDTTAANSWQFAANGGIAYGSGSGTIARTIAQGNNVCILISAGNRVPYSVSYVLSP